MMADDVPLTTLHVEGVRHIWIRTHERVFILRELGTFANR